MFHALGYLHSTIAMLLGSTLVLRRRFKPATVLADIERHQVTAMVVVPVMLSRILDELDKTSSKPNLSSLRIVFVSGSQLGSELATRALKDLGPGTLSWAQGSANFAANRRAMPAPMPAPTPSKKA